MIAPRNMPVSQEVASFSGGSDIFVFGAAPADDQPAVQGGKGWVWYDPQRIALGKFIEKIDFLVSYPGSDAEEIPFTAIAMAMVRGIPVLLDPESRPHAGRGPIYIEPARITTAVKEFSADERRLRALRLETASSGALLFGPQQHRRRLGEYARPAQPTIITPGQKSETVRLLMLSSNGTGLGHVSRLLAIARR